MKRWQNLRCGVRCMSREEFHLHLRREKNYVPDNKQTNNHHHHRRRRRRSRRRRHYHYHHSILVFNCSIVPYCLRKAPMGKDNKGCMYVCMHLHHKLYLPSNLQDSIAVNFFDLFFFDLPR